MSFLAWAARAFYGVGMMMLVVHNGFYGTGDEFYACVGAVLLVASSYVLAEEQEAKK